VFEASRLRADGERVARTRLGGEDGGGAAHLRRSVLIGQVHSRLDERLSA
jgi:hypothetical protein